MTNLPGWSYCKIDEIELVPDIGTNYSFKFKLHYGSGNDNNTEVYLNEHCATDFRDIRFTTSSGSFCPYWIETKEDGDYAECWVKVGEDLSKIQQLSTPYAYGVKGDYWIAQTFLPKSSFVLKSIELYLNRSLAATEGNFVVSIQATSNGEPSGQDLVSSTIPISDLPTSYSWFEISFQDLELAKGVLYSIVIRYPEGGGTATVDLKYSDANPYPDGQIFKSSDGGSSWIGRANEDLGFKINGVFQLFLYYGNPNAISESNPDEALVFFDDFEDGDFDEWDQSDNWEITSESPAQGTLCAKGTGLNYLRKNLPEYAQKSAKFTFYVKVQNASKTSYYFVYPIFSNNDKYRLLASYYKTASFAYWDISDSKWKELEIPTPVSNNTWYKVEFAFSYKSGKYYVFINGENKTPSGVSNLVGSYIKSYYNQASGYTGYYQWLDYFYITKFVETEPQHTWSQEILLAKYLFNSFSLVGKVNKFHSFKRTEFLSLSDFFSRAWHMKDSLSLSSQLLPFKMLKQLGELLRPKPKLMKIASETLMDFLSFLENVEPKKFVKVLDRVFLEEILTRFLLPILFSTGFETGDYIRWDKKVGTSIYLTTEKSHHGTYSLKTTGGAGFRYLSKKFSQYPYLSVRTYIWAKVTPTSDDLFRGPVVLGFEFGDRCVGVALLASGDIYTANISSGGEGRSWTPLDWPQEEWFRLEISYRFSTETFEIFVNDKHYSTTIPKPDAPFTGIRIGSMATIGKFTSTVYFDCIALSTQHIGIAGDPPPPEHGIYQTLFVLGSVLTTSIKSLKESFIIFSKVLSFWIKKVLKEEDEIVVNKEG